MSDRGSGFDQWVEATDNGHLGGSSGSLRLGEILPHPSSAGSVGVVGTLESSLLPQHDIGRSLLQQSPTTSLPDSSSPPQGWPGFINAATMGGGAQSEGNDKLTGSLPSRGGLFDNEQFIRQLADTSSTRTPNSLGGSRPMTVSQSGPWRGFSYPDPGEELPGLHRPETPVLAYVDRASMPGYIDTEERECHIQQLHRDTQLRQVSSWSASQDAKNAHAQSLQDWEADLLAFKRFYGCSDVEPLAQTQEGDSLADRTVDAPMMNFSQLATEMSNIDENVAMTEGSSSSNFQPVSDVPSMIHAAPRESMVDIDIRSAELHRPSVPQSHRPSVLPERPIAPESGGPLRASVLDTQISMSELSRASEADSRGQYQAQLESQKPETIETLSREAIPNVSTDAREVQSEGVIPPRPECGPRESMLNTNIDSTELLQGTTGTSQRPSVIPPRSGCGTGQELPFVSENWMSKGIGQSDRNGPLNETTLLPPGEMTDGLDAELRKESEALDQARDPVRDRGEVEDMLAVARQQGQELKEEIVRLQRDVLPSQVVAATPLTPKSPTAPAPPDSIRRPSGGRRLEYTAQDLDVATERAMTRVKPDGSWRSEYSEIGLQKRDFLGDIRKQRERDKGRQATGPVWSHLSTQAKNLANTFDLPELLESLKLFASVRFDDYELYMRLLGEVPNHVSSATAAQLCELVRILARRRLRERNYVDMVAAHLLQKIRVTDDALPARHLVKAANAFAALECRSNPKFVEHFLRHMEHRLQEFDASLCCLVSPVFVNQYMNDALRRAYLIRCTETQAGFQCELQDARNIACMELVMRKEHHSLLSSFPSYVGRYLEKVRRHAEFDKWGAVTLPPTVAPDGPKGNERVAMNHSLQLKASTATSGSGRQADVFSSDMHRDVSACLTHLGIDHENGALAGPYLLDIVALDMVTPSKRIVYEINSEHHYYVGTNQLIAEKRLRHRMIGRLGHKLHMVNSDDWKKLSAAQKMTFMLKMQQAQQDVNAKDEKQKAAANTMRAPLPALPAGPSTSSDPMKLKSISDLRAPIRVPVPPSQRSRLPLTAR